MFNEIHQALDPSRDQVKELLEKGDHKPRVFTLSNLFGFFSYTPTVGELVSGKPEILIFSILQWITIGLAYLAWTQMLHWIPDEVWVTISESSRNNTKPEFYFVNLALLGWSFLIVCVAAYPIGLCTAAMVAVHDLRTCNEKVTLVRCLAIADQHLGKIWMFTIVDGWITVNAILDRLPKKHYNRTALDELLYYAWKVATIAVVPSLVNGRSLFFAGKDSLKLLTSQPIRVLRIRFGYSAVCWVIGVLTYIGSYWVFFTFGHGSDKAHFIYNFYFLMGAPIFIAVGIISVFVRPFYLLSVAKLYTDTIDVREEIEGDIKTIPEWEQNIFSWKIFLFLALLTTVIVAVFFADEIGLTQWIAHLSQADLSAIH